MEMKEIHHAPWTCRWGRFVGRLEGCLAAQSESLDWSCCQPELCPSRRIVAIDECAVCPLWEPSTVPPCAAMGWEHR